MNFQDQLPLIPVYLAAHLQLTLVALALGILLSLPLGLIAARSKRLEQLVLAAAGVIQTIPSLALLAVIVPLLAGLKLPSIGYLPAVTGLTLYCLLPILRNTVTGLREVDPAYTEAALGVGMNPRQSLFMVELPLALPVIVAGIRTAAVWTVGMATLSTPVGAPSLGNFIFTGLQTRNYAAVITGSVVAAVLSLILDSLVRLIEVGLQRRKRSSFAAAAILFVILIACMVIPGVSGSNRNAQVTIGAKTFTEQFILGEMLAQKVQKDSGLETKVLSSLGSTVAFDALCRNQIDAYVDYSGTIWSTIMKRTTIPKDRAALLQEMKDYLLKEYGVSLVASLGFENTYALAMPRNKAEALHIKAIGDLRGVSQNMTIGSDYEFLGRPEWKAVTSQYGISFGKSRSMDPSLMYQAIANGSVDVISAFSTDGRISAGDLLILEDNLGAIPPYDAIILASPRASRERPAVIEALKTLAGKISAENMRRLNMLVDQQHENPATVARIFLNELTVQK